ncbi:MAG: gluconate 2-dehydrogenase subunit 3 family protein [Cyclobacteriaceae bacterium]
MKRRRALKGMISIVGGIGLTFFGYKLFNIYSTPSINKLSATSNKAIISELAAMVIPHTDVPGANEANICDTIIQLISNCADVQSINKFIDGLEELEQRTYDLYGTSFVKCTGEEKEKIMNYFESDSNSQNDLLNKVQIRLFGKPFFSTLKEYVSYAYCTSLVGAKDGLRYNYIPGKYEGCIAVNNPRSWATH